MESLGWVTLAPGEDGYAFRFTSQKQETSVEDREHL
jgi:hypothetical protein